MGKIVSSSVDATRVASEGFDRAYRLWVRAQCSFAVVALLTALPFVPVLSSWAALALAVWGPASMVVLFVVAVRFAPSTIGNPFPHVLTGVRLVAATGLLVLTWRIGIETGRWDGGVDGLPHMVLSDAQQWWLFGVLAVAAITDFIDGKVARYLGPKGFGSIWDMENDAYYALALSVAAWLTRGVPIFVLAIGAMRYVYFFVVRAVGDPPDYPPVFKLFSRTVTATLITVLVAAFFPPLGLVARTVAVAGALALQLVSFGWDFALQLRAGNVRLPSIWTVRSSSAVGTAPADRNPYRDDS